MHICFALWVTLYFSTISFLSFSMSLQTKGIFYSLILLCASFSSVALKPGHKDLTFNIILEPDKVMRHSDVMVNLGYFSYTLWTYLTPTVYLLIGIDSRHPDYLVLLYRTSLSSETRQD